MYKMRKKMTKLFKIVAFLGAIVLLTTPSFAAKKVKWKLAMTWPKQLTPLASPPQKLAKLVKNKSRKLPI